MHKLWLHPDKDNGGETAEAAYRARRASDYGVHVGDISIDMMKIRERKRNMVISFRSGNENKRSTRSI